MKVIVYTRPDDGGLSVVHPGISLDDPAGFTEEQALARAWKDVPDDAINSLAIDAADLPKDRSYRNAWTLDRGDGTVKLDAVRKGEIDARKLAKEAR